MLPRSANAQRYAHDPEPVRREDIGTPDNLRKLRRPFTDPEWFRPGRTVRGITADAADLKLRTLTKLYNARPAWLALAHQELDSAVAAAYGWSDYTPAMPDEEILRRLLALNLQRSAAG